MDATDTNTVKEVLTVASPLIKAVVDTFVTPALSSLKKRVGTDYKKIYIPTEENFSEYFYRTYKRLIIINTLVFNNSQKFLKEIYVPLTLTSKSATEEKRYKISSFPENLLNSSGKVLITDSAGMGKSTLIKKLFLDVIDHKKGIPLLVELRRLSENRKILTEIQEQLDSLAKEFDKTLLLELLSDGGFYIFLDGFDEIPLEDREAVSTDLQSFISKASDNKFVLTSRPENALKSFGDFQEFAIEPLKKKEAFELLRKYDKQGPTSALLIKKLEQKEMSSVGEFLTNPLLVSLLFTAFQHKQKIPFKKHIFYRQVYDANFESHDLTKGDSYTHDKHSRLEIDDFHRILRHVGFSCLKANQRIEFDKDEILALIREAKAFCVDLSFNESDFLKDILSTVPLFTQDGHYYRWSHKSLQEYFAAQFIYLDTKGQQVKLILQLYRSPKFARFLNILDLYYDIDTKSFRNSVLLDHLEKFEKYTKKFFVFPMIEKEKIKHRQEVCFQIQAYCFLMPQQDDESDEKLDEMIDKIPKSSSVSLVALNNDKQLYCLICSEETVRLNTILVNKIPNLFKSKNSHNTSLNEGNLKIRHSLSNFYEPHLIDNNSNNQFNSPDNFEDVTKLISASKLNSPQIDSAVAFALLKELRSQQIDQKNEQFDLTNV